MSGLIAPVGQRNCKETSPKQNERRKQALVEASTAQRGGLRFRQQAPIDRFVVDFVCFGKRLIVEVDGATHSTSDERQRDKDREDFLITQGFRVVRFFQ